MTEHAEASFLIPILIFCAGAVIAVPVFNRAGLGAVVGYLVAGIAIGPSGFKLFTDAHTVRGVAELGIVLLLFVIGLGLAQFAVSAVVIGLAAAALGLAAGGAVIVGVALAMSATAIALQLLD